VARSATTPVREADLQQWKLLAPFHQALAEAVTQCGAHRSFEDPRRLLEVGDYLSLFLFGLLNPVVRTMRGLCEASRLERVQREVCTRPVSLGSFSETQHLLSPALLERVFTQLREQVHGVGGDPRLRDRPWLLQDSTLWEALPRMHWAVYGGGKAGQTNHAVRLHLSFHLLEDKPLRAVVTPGARCERAVWREHWETGDCYVGDRYFGEDYSAFGQLQQRQCQYVIRLRDQAVIEVEEELALSPADTAARVMRQAWVRLGRKAGGPRVRVVWVQAPEEVLVLVTNQDPDQLSAELVALLYRYRWQIELFFRWIKCILGCRHWLAESPGGVTVQVYLALIASLLLQLFTGQRPSRRTMELLQMHCLGWASNAELVAGLQRELARETKKQGA
jgi:hypothetical protein